MLGLIILSALLVLCSGAGFNQNHFPGRIVNGTAIDISEVPYQLALEWGGWHQCGATLITDRFALTSGFCVHQLTLSSTTIRTGSSLVEEGGTVIPVKRIIRHPYYQDWSREFNIALVELATAVQFDKNSQPAKLAEKEPKDGDMVRFSGWGFIRGKAPGSHLLQAVEIPILDRGTCRSWSAAAKVNITDTMICANGSGKGPCAYDEGGPVVFNGTLVGTFTSALGCGNYFLPAISNNMVNPEIRDFIYRNTGLN